MNIQNTRLADFTQGWKPHDDHPGIVLIDAGYPEIFMVAANDESCQAAILAVEESQKHTDREAFKRAALHTREAGEDMLGIYYSEKRGFYKPRGHLQSAMPQISALTKRHALMSGNREIVTSIIENFGKNSIGKVHPKHSHPVSNRVFFAGGTLLKTNNGWHGTPEGDCLYIKEGFEHEPNREKLPNAEFDKLLVVSRYIYTRDLP